MKVKRLVQEKRNLLAVLLVLLSAGVTSGVTAAAQSVSLVPNITRFAGIGTNSRGFNSDTGPATTVELDAPTGMAFDTAGNLLIADQGNNCVRRVSSGTGNVVATIAGLSTGGANDTCNASSNRAPAPAQGLLTPSGVAIDAANTIYIADTGHNCVRQLASGSTGVANLTTTAGTCGADEDASTTPAPVSLQIDGAGNLYILIRANALAIYQVLRHDAGSAAGTVCRVAGAASPTGVALCAGITATTSLNSPNSIALDGAGALYIADTRNNCVRKNQNNAFTVAAGTCGSAASIINAPTGLAFSNSGSLYISSSDNNQLLRYNQSSGQLVLIAGNPNMTPGAYAVTQDGQAATSVPLNQPSALVEDANNNLYLADAGNSILRELKTGNLFPQTTVGQTSPQQRLTFEINASSTLTVMPGTDYAVVAGTDSCTGPHTAAPTGSSPTFCAVGVTFTPTAAGNRYSPITITDTSVTPNTRVVAGLQGVGVGALAQLLPGQANTFASGLGSVLDVNLDAAGNVYVLHKPAGAGPSEVLRYAAGGGAATVFLPGTLIPNAVALAQDAAGDFFVASTTTIQRFGADGSVAANYATGLTDVRAIAADGFGNLLVAAGTRVMRIFVGGETQTLAGGGTAPGTEGAIATAVTLLSPSGVALAPNGLVYFSDAGAHVVYSVDAAGILHLVAGNGTINTTTPNTALGQALTTPAGLGVDAAGDLFITDRGKNAVYVVFASSAATDNLRRILGDNAGTNASSGDGAAATSAAVATPDAVAPSPSGITFVASSGGSVRDVTYPGSTLDFGSVAVNSVTMLPQGFWNNGNGILLRTGDPVVSNPVFVYDSADTTCGSAVIAGLLCNLSFTFEPTTTGTQTATATVADSAASSPQTVHLTGNVVPALLTSFVADAETEQYGGPYVGTVTIKTNGGTIPNGTVTFTINNSVTCSVTGDLIGSVSCMLPTGTQLPVRAATYPVVVTFTGNYPNQTANTTLTETRRALTEVVDNQTKVYLDPNPTLTGTPNGLLTGVGNDSFSVTYGFGATTITRSTLPGTYTKDIVATITPNGSTNPNNYTITNTPGTFTITQATLPGFGAAAETEAYGGAYTATASFTQPSGGAVPTGTVTFQLGAKVLCTAVISTTASCTVPAGTLLQVGTYAITASYPGDVNYTAASATTTLTVTPVPLTISAANQTKAFGAPVPALTGTVTGLVNGDTVGTTVNVAYATTVTASTPIGTYPNSITATPSGSSIGNYTVTVTPGSFVVTGIATTAALTTTASTVSAGTPITFTLKVTSGGSRVPDGTVVFTSDGTIFGTAALDSSGTATLPTTSLPAGTHTIVASYSGNASFAASSGTLAEVITVPVGAFAVGFTPNTQLIRGPGSTVYTVVVTSTSGFTGSVSLGCSGLPADATCVFGQTTLTIAPGASATTTLTATTTSADAVVSANRLMPARPDSGRLGALAISAAAAFPMQLSGLGLLAAGIRRRKKLGHTQMRILLLMLLAVGLIGFSGCGYPSSVHHIYPITVTATSVGGGPAPVSATAYLAVGLPQ